MDFTSLDFSRSIGEIQNDLIIKPIIQNYLFDASFPDFAMHFRNHKMEREPDGFFHPSTHPLWPSRMLYHYIAHPHLMVAEKKEYMGTLSVTIGTAMHGFMGVCLTDAGLMPAALQECKVCPPGTEPHEPGVIDEEAGERGHMDGLLDLSHLSVPKDKELPGYEFKTSNMMKLAKVKDMDLATYREKWPDYYAQNQSYMRMSGRRWMIVLFMGMGFPWPMVEIHVPYDPTFAQGVRNKYLAVRQAVADQRAPLDCCGAKEGRGCPAGRICRGGLR